ncbi:MAG: hypothetical protein JWQ09_4803 [Segetibacter sp.]|nr:hypothetical protein [Segetibacter sp.]
MMTETDRDIAKKVHDMQAKGKDYALVGLPGFLEWSNKKSSSGGNEAAIDHMLAMSMFLLPEEILSVSEDDFNEIYYDIISELE